jgi:hypothetical protein
MEHKPVPSIAVMQALDSVDTNVARALRSIKILEDAANQLGMTRLQDKLHRLRDVLQDAKTASNLARQGG